MSEAVYREAQKGPSAPKTLDATAGGEAKGMEEADAGHVDFDALSAKQLKSLLTTQGVDVRDCLNKADLVVKAKSLPAWARHEEDAEPPRRCPRLSMEAKHSLSALQTKCPVPETLQRILASAGTKGIRSLLQTQGVDTRDCLEKQDLVAKAQTLLERESGADVKKDNAGRLNLARVRYDLAALMKAPDHDDGSYIPLLIRNAWHCCGTFDKATQTGGSNGGTMRFPVEQSDPENAGLGKAREVLAPIHKKYPWLSLADLYVLAGTVAIEESGGPAIPFAYGRRDFTSDQAEAVFGAGKCPFAHKDGVFNPEGSRLPAADLGPDPKLPKGSDPAKREAATIKAVRGTFHRMGFDDKETVCLIVLGHQFGRCHPEHSGFRGTWYGFAPTSWNVYGPGGLGYLSVYEYAHSFQETIDPDTGKRQFNNTMFGGDPSDPRFMLLVADMALVWDPIYKQHLDWYNHHRLEFRSDAAKAWKKLIELGCPPGLLTEERNARPACACQGRTACEPCRANRKFYTY